MTRWSHKVVPLAFEKSDQEAVLQGYGIDGWQLVGIQNGLAYLKKEDIQVAPALPVLPPTSYFPAPAHAQSAGNSVPDADAPWHWLPRSEVGEKRIEAVTSQDVGLVSPAHSHRVVAIIGPDKKVVRGKTDNVSGHEHNVTVLGNVEEADGHVHTFSTYP